MEQYGTKSATQTYKIAQNQLPAHAAAAPAQPVAAQKAKSTRKSSQGNPGANAAAASNQNNIPTTVDIQK